MTRLGIETVPQIVTRGWLVDVAWPRAGRRHRARRRRPTSTLEPGDAVLFHTGWGAHWDDPDTLPLRRARARAASSASGWPTRGVALTGCDTWSYGPVPAEDPDRPFEVPQILNVRHGVFIVENLDLARAGGATACASSR